MSISDVPAASTAIPIGDAGTQPNGKGPAAPSAAVAPAGLLKTVFRKAKAPGEWKRGLALFDFLMRLLTIGATLGATIAMGTTDETLPFFTVYYQFHASYSNFPQLTFFVVANAVAACYLVLSLPFSIVGICRPSAVGLRILLLIFDVIMVGLTSAAAASAAAIVYLAHEGNSSANWVAICIRFESFCQETSGAVVSSFIAVVFFLVLVVMSAVALRKH